MTKQKLRTPEDYYFSHGRIHFSQQDRELYYEIWLNKKDGFGDFRYSNKQKLQTDELEVLRTFTKQEQVIQHLNTKVSNN